MMTPNERQMYGAKQGVTQRALTLGFASPPSFARALRRRGLIAHTAASAQFVSMAAVYESHLRRQSMEWAFAATRGD